MLCRQATIYIYTKCFTTIKKDDDDRFGLLTWMRVHSSLKNSFQKNIIMYRALYIFFFKEKGTLLHFSFFFLHLFLNEDRRQHFLSLKQKVKRLLPFSILFLASSWSRKLDEVEQNIIIIISFLSNPSLHHPLLWTCRMNNDVSLCYKPFFSFTAGSQWMGPSQNEVVAEGKKNKLRRISIFFLF